MQMQSLAGLRRAKKKLKTKTQKAMVGTFLLWMDSKNEWVFF
jgi:hypothetical protein